MVIRAIEKHTFYDLQKTTAISLKNTMSASGIRSHIKCLPSTFDYDTERVLASHPSLLHFPMDFCMAKILCKKAICTHGTPSRVCLLYTSDAADDWLVV